MDDYISRNAAMAMPLANGQYDHEHANEHFILGLESYKEWLEYVPAANVRPVVLCKDCEFLKVGKVSMICAKGILSFIYPSDYCSRGKNRRADNG